MIIKRPKAADPADELLAKAMKSDDSILKAKTTQYFLDMVADHCQTPAGLYEILAAIPDPEQRYMVLDAVKPLVSFSTDDMVFEDGPDAGQSKGETIN